MATSTEKGKGEAGRSTKTAGGATSIPPLRSNAMPHRMRAPRRLTEPGPAERRRPRVSSIATRVHAIAEASAPTTLAVHVKAVEAAATVAAIARAAEAGARVHRVA